MSFKKFKNPIIVAGTSRVTLTWWGVAMEISTPWEEIVASTRYLEIRQEGTLGTRPWRTDVTEIRISTWWARCRNGSRKVETAERRQTRTLRPRNRVSLTPQITIYWCRSCISLIASWSGIDNSLASASIWSWANWLAGNRRIKVTRPNGHPRTNIRPRCLDSRSLI